MFSNRSLPSFYYAAAYVPIAISITFLPVWMRSAGLTVHQIGIVAGIGIGLRIVTTPAIAHAADRSNKRKNLLIAIVLASAGVSSLYHFADSFVPILLVYALAGIFSANILPLGDSLVLSHIKRFGLSYGAARRWGSLSVACLSVALGMAIDKAGATIVVPFLVCSYVALLAVVFRLPASPSDAAAIGPAWPLLDVLRQRTYILFLLGAATVQSSHAVFYFYSSLYWLKHGLSPTTIGWLWGIGILSEIAVFSLAQRTEGRLSAAAHIAWGGAFAVVRWGLLAHSGDFGTAVFVQCLQGGSLALTQVGVARFVTASVPQKYLSSATGLYHAFAYGLLNAAFAYVGGLLYGAADWSPFLLASGACAVALLCAGALMRLPVERYRTAETRGV